MKNSQNLNLQFLTFELKIGDKHLHMALNVQKVKEVVFCDSLTPMITEDHSLCGIYDLRGAPVPVINLNSLIIKDKEPLEIPAGTRLMICELNNSWIALPLHKSGRIINCSADDFIPPPAGTNRGKSRLISGLIKTGKSYIPVLDIDTILWKSGMIAEPEHQHDYSKDLSYAGVRILVAEDSPIMLKKITSFFKSLQIDVDGAMNGEEAWKMIKANPEGYDLLFTDIEMPLLDGISLARKLKSTPECYHIPILFNSALSNPAMIRDIVAENLGSYLVKYDEESIVQKISEVIKPKNATKDAA
ncbi:MAG: chemotaxis protein CheW [Bacteriovorax sp.]|jgi:two-component system chemotaxis response regulator CheV